MSLLVCVICSCCVTPDAELTFLAFALARGSVAKVLQSLSGICEHLDLEYRASSLLKSMATVRLRLLHKHGNTPHTHTHTPKTGTMTSLCLFIPQFVYLSVCVCVFLVFYFDFVLAHREAPAAAPAGL